MVKKMPRMTVLKTLIAAGAFALGAQSASAATYTFNFGESAGSHFTQGPLSLDVATMTFAATGGSAKTLVAAPGSELVNELGGLGEFLSGSDGNSAVNGVSNLTREALNFVFSQAVRLTQVTFFNGSGNYIIFTNGAGDAVADSGTVAPTVNFTSPAYSGTAIGIGARTNTAFYVSSITVDTDVPAVPVPAAGLLLGSLVVVPFLRRKRRAA